MPLLTNVDDFLDTVRKSGLVEPEILDAQLGKFRAADFWPEEPKQLASALIRVGVLTPFQARFLLQGKWRNLLLASKYKLLDMVGAGGMGNVYKAEHAFMRRKVALKVLPTHLNEYPSAVQRFYREARAVASLDHPNIVRAHDVDREGHLHFLVMEYVDGVSLQELVKQSGPLPPDRAVQYICQAASGLQHAHQAGWVHRDIKPGNILVDRNGTIKILDLGLARLFENEGDQLTRQLDGKAVLGTADYLAPEQALNSDVDIRADIYSLGCTLYYLLAGHPPFPTGNASQKLMAHQMHEPRPIRQIRPEVPEHLALVLARMMHKSPDGRYPTPEAALRDLLPFAALSQPALESVTPHGREASPSSGAALSGMSRLTLNPGGAGLRSATASSSTSPLQSARTEVPEDDSEEDDPLTMHGYPSRPTAREQREARTPRPRRSEESNSRLLIVGILAGAFALGGAAAAVAVLMLR